MSPEQQKLALDTTWIVAASALVFFMQAGFAMLEGGLVRAKNAVNVIMKNYTDMCFGGIAFWAIGYGLMFGTNSTGLFGTDKFFLNTAEPMEYTKLLFQMMFAATAATIVSGAMAERIRFMPYIVAATVISLVIYPIFGSWVWNSQGWLAKMGFIDFAGSTVVHSVGAWASLAGLIVLGPRLGRYGSDGSPRPIEGHNLPLVAFGGLVLWLGWFGFNGGSTLEANASIGKIVLNTHLSGCAGVVGFVMMRMILGGKLLMTHTVNGGLAGLVGITAGCATMSPTYAIITGLLAGMVCVIAMSLLDPLMIDDAVGAIPVHGACGIWGTLAAGIFKEGDMYNWGIIQTQLIGIAACGLWTFATSWVMFRLIKLFTTLRCSSVEEQRGLDYTEHHELGYPEFQASLHE
jgi:ammonium transporter, Amt family